MNHIRTLHFRLLLVTVFALTLAIMAQNPAQIARGQGDGESENAIVWIGYGDTLEVWLPYTPDSGYEWTLDYVQFWDLKPLGDPELVVTPSEADGGAEGLAIWRFKAVGSDVTPLRLALPRPGEEDEEPLDTFETVVWIEPSGAEPRTTVLLDARFPVDEVRLAPGDELVVQLDANETTGYEWTVAEVDEDVLQQVGEPGYVPDQPVAPGSGGTSVWEFQAADPGETALRLEYAASYESDPEPYQVFEVAVIVSE
jgi:inhibitor of cysteine peptidase